MKEYPYMYARVSAKRAKLLDSSDYEKLLKMQPNEIARFLEEREYREAIDELAAKYDGVELVELGLNRNLSNTLAHLVEISPEPLKKVINAYLRKYDIISLKRLLRWKKGGQQDSINALFIPAGSLSFETLEEMSEKSFEEIVDSIGFRDSRVDYQDYLEGKQELREIEAALDQAYYDELEMIAGETRNDRFKRFLKKELEYENLRTALRLKKYGFNAEDIENHLGNRNGSDLVEEVMEAENIDRAIEILREHGRAEESEDRLEDVEHALNVERLQDALQMLHIEPLGMTSILGYIIAKIVEVNNLRVLVRAKETGIQNLETIRSNLVTA